MKKQIEKLDINLFPSDLEEEYTKQKAEWQDNKDKYIREYEEYTPGGFLATGYYSKRPDVGALKADEIFGKEFEEFKEWSNECKNLTSSGQQSVIDKINELVEAFNSLKKTK